MFYLHAKKYSLCIMNSFRQKSNAEKSAENHKQTGNDGSKRKHSFLLAPLLFLLFSSAIDLHTLATRRFNANNNFRTILFFIFIGPDTQ